MLSAKHVYAAYAAADAFWWGAVPSLHDFCQLEQVRYAVLNGDGAGWIRQGLAHLPHCEFQWDRWHLGQAVKAGLGWHAPSSRRLYVLLQAGAEWTSVARLFQRAHAQAPDGSTAAAIERLRRYLWENRDGLQDYRRRALPIPHERAWRGLGAAEANIDKPWGRRLTGRGMSWSTGLAGLVRLMNLHQQGTLAAWLEVCGWKPFAPAVRETAEAIQGNVTGAEPGGWLQARVPVLSGPRTQLRRTLRAISADR
jgi:hypothetical protein